MTKGNDTLKIPGKTTDKNRQKNNGNNGNRVRLIIELELKTFQLAQVRHLTAATTAVRACAFVHA